MDRVAVVAIGGNSLVRERDASVGAARAALAATALHLSAMASSGWALAITHGNGPQVGFGLLRSDAAAAVAPRLPLDVLGAETQGSIGYRSIPRIRRWSIQPNPLGPSTPVSKRNAACVWTGGP